MPRRGREGDNCQHLRPPPRSFNIPTLRPPLNQTPTKTRPYPSCVPSATDRTALCPPRSRSLSANLLNSPISHLNPSTNFLLGFELYFDIKDVTSSRKKILMVGLSVTGFVELNAWWSGSMATHLAKTYEQFIKDLKREALPRDYVWEVKREIRESKQRGRSYGEWSGTLKLAQQAISTAAMSDLELVKNLIYNMEEELARYLRQHEVLLGTGYHEDDRDAIGLGASTPTLEETAVPPPADNVAIRSIDYSNFDKTARNQWSVIASRRADVARQVGAARKSTTSGNTSVKGTGSVSSPVPTTTSRPLTDTSRTTPTAVSAALTPLERAYLSATYGCTKCRKSRQKHRAISCPSDIISRERVPVSSSFKPGNTVPLPSGFTPATDSYAPAPSSTSATTTPAERVAAGLRGFSLIEDVDDEEKTLDWSTGDEDDEYAELHLPPLSLRAGDVFHGSEVGQALADSGCSSIYISDRMVEKLGLEKQRLKRTRVAKLAIRGGTAMSLEITHYVQVPLLLDGSVSFGTTLLKIAPLEPPYDFILGNPFLQRHQLSIHLHPHPRLLRAAHNGEEELDLLEVKPAHGPATLKDPLCWDYR
ncbi:hypothetical protein JCM11641_007045 [Rhodosporidiobolus odoratus]